MPVNKTSTTTANIPWRLQIKNHLFFKEKTVKMLCQDLFQVPVYSHLLPVFRGSNSDDHTGSSSGLGSWFTWPSQEILLSQWHLSGLLPLTAAGPHRNYTGLLYYALQHLYSYEIFNNLIITYPNKFVKLLIIFF